MNVKEKIDFMLSPGEHFDAGYLEPATKIAFVRRILAEVGDIKELVRSINHKDLVRTPYWEAVEAYWLMKHGRHCRVCGWTPADGAEIHIHQNDARAFGMEFSDNYAYAFTPICATCMERLHDHCNDILGNIEFDYKKITENYKK